MDEMPIRRRRFVVIREDSDFVANGTVAKSADPQSHGD
jgi:hypothetical protein